MTDEIDRSKEWTANGMRGVPGFPTIAAKLEEAASAVETIERAKRAFDTLIRAIEAEGYSVFVDPEGNYSVELKDAETTPPMEMGEAIRDHGLPEIDRSPSPYWRNYQTIGMGGA